MFPERFKKDITKIKTEDGRVFELPLVFYRNLSAAKRLSNKFEKLYLKDIRDDFQKVSQALHRNFIHKQDEFYAESIKTFDCHIFLFRCLGFNIELKDLKSFVRNKQDFAFDVFSHKEYMSFEHEEDFIKKIEERFESFKTNILACQIHDSKHKLQHSLFFVKEGDEILTAEKLGYGGIVQYTLLKDGALKYYKHYGNQFAFEDYYELATNPRLVSFFNNKEFIQNYAK